MLSKQRGWLADWSGVLLLMVIGVAVLWLGGTGQLPLYIHPRYVVFTIGLTTVGVLLASASLVVNPVSAKQLPRGGWRQGGIVGLVLLVAGMMLVVAPQTLGTVTASQRVINSGVAGGSTRPSEASLLQQRGSYLRFDVRDWASLLAQADQPSLYQHKPAKLSGLVAPSPDDADVFFVSRFVVSCCAVDARPVGVPVYQPGWQQRFKADDWVEVNGEFIGHPTTGISHKTVVRPDYITAIERPENPYVY